MVGVLAGLTIELTLFWNCSAFLGNSVVSLPTCVINDGTTEATMPPTSSTAMQNTMMIAFCRLNPRFLWNQSTIGSSR